MYFYVVVKYMIAIILIILIVIIVVLLIRNGHTTETMDNESPQTNQKETPKKVSFDEDIFYSAKYHQDYMDVITAINNLSPNQRQVFNINNVRCTVTKDVDENIVRDIAKDLIITINEEIRSNVPTVRSVNSGWDEALPDPNMESGFEKVQGQLGLPKSLYNTPLMKTPISLVSFSNITKYETENEIKYKFKLTISKKTTLDKLVLWISVVNAKNISGKSRLIIENIDVDGYITPMSDGVDRVLSDDFYYFDNLENNNMITGKKVLDELNKKYAIKRKIMQERIDNVNPEEREKYDTPSPSEYASYQTTQSIYDDITTDKIFSAN